MVLVCTIYCNKDSALFPPLTKKIKRKVKYRASPSTWYMESSSKR